jgi:ribosomal protein S18 acetylase RimI-like enzyme
MIQLSPGTVLNVFTAKDGREVMLRTPKWDDLQDLIDFINSLVEEEAMIARHIKVTRDQEIDWLADILKKLEKGQHIYIVAEVNGKMVGSSGISPMFGRMSHVGALGISVKDGYRGIGIGLDLMKEAEKHAIHMGLKSVKLEVFENNEPAIGLYERMGYMLTGRVPEAVLYKGEYVDSLIMTKKLLAS